MRPYIYTAKEYNGDRPCIDPLTMAELRIRLSVKSSQETLLKSSWIAILLRYIKP